MGIYRQTFDLVGGGTKTIKHSYTRSPMYILIEDTKTAVFCVDYWTNEITYLFKSRDVDNVFSISNNNTEITINNLSSSLKRIYLSYII